MSDIVIQAEKISKYYRLGKIGSGSLRRDIQEWWMKSVLRKEDSFQLSYNDKNTLWALKDINLEIKEGEAWGIIGRNGAGKSTFLKILSRIIKPTYGSIKGKGKVSSLLEVGTGFHSELTGRENIYISGHILGMSKLEIKKRFNDIVDFSGVENFIDTPVKRYSSGMYVRLAFAVAAHLEPDILIVDEVLAVGDAEFQKKCLGKMKDASTNKGRTIIFVSHNMSAVNNICSKALWLDKGTVQANGDAKSVVNSYLGVNQKQIWKKEFNNFEEAPGLDILKVLLFELVPNLSNTFSPIDIRTPLSIKFRFYNHIDDITLNVGIHLFTLADECIFDLSHPPRIFKKGIIEGEFLIPGNFLNDGSYYLSLIFVRETYEILFRFNEVLFFDVEDFRENTKWYGKWIGYVRPQFPITFNYINL